MNVDDVLNTCLIFSFDGIYIMTNDEIPNKFCYVVANITFII